MVYKYPLGYGPIIQWTRGAPYLQPFLLFVMYQVLVAAVLALVSWIYCPVCTVYCAQAIYYVYYVKLRVLWFVWNHIDTFDPVVQISGYALVGFCLLVAIGKL